MDRHLGYNRVSLRPQRAKGFRLHNHRRFSVYRVKFLYFIKTLSRWTWKCSFGCLKKSTGRSSCKRSSSRKSLAAEGTARPEYKLRSYGRSNSFYSEAIADCLEFIKRSAHAVDEKSVAER